MARKIDLKQSGFIDEAKPSSDGDFEELWLKLNRQRNAALALSPKLDEWFGKEFPPQTFET